MSLLFPPRRSQPSTSFVSLWVGLPDLLLRRPLHTFKSGSVSRRGVGPTPRRLGPEPASDALEPVSRCGRARSQRDRQLILLAKEPNVPKPQSPWDLLEPGPVDVHVSAGTASAGLGPRRDACRPLDLWRALVPAPPHEWTTGAVRGARHASSARRSDPPSSRSRSPPPRVPRHRGSSVHRAPAWARGWDGRPGSLRSLGRYHASIRVVGAATGPSARLRPLPPASTGPLPGGAGAGGRSGGARARPALTPPDTCRGTEWAIEARSPRPQVPTTRPDFLARGGGEAGGRGGETPTHVQKSPRTRKIDTTHQPPKGIRRPCFHPHPGTEYSKRGTSLPTLDFFLISIQMHNRGFFFYLYS